MGDVSCEMGASCVSVFIRVNVEEGGYILLCFVPDVVVHGTLESMKGGVASFGPTSVAVGCRPSPINHGFGVRLIEGVKEKFDGTRGRIPPHVFNDVDNLLLVGVNQLTPLVPLAPGGQH